MPIAGTGQDTNLLGVWAYRISIGENRFDIGAAIAVVMVTITAILTVVYSTRLVGRLLRQIRGTASKLAGAAGEMRTRLVPGLPLSCRPGRALTFVAGYGRFPG